MQKNLLKKESLLRYIFKMSPQNRTQTPDTPLYYIDNHESN